MRTVKFSFIFFTMQILSGCNQQPAATSNSAAPAATPAIAIIKPEQRTIQRIIEQPGTVQPFEETILYPKIPGYVRALTADPEKTKHPAHDRFIDIGSRVKKDQILTELAVPELEEEYQQKEALVRQSEAEVIQSKKSAVAYAAGVEAAKANVAETKAALTKAQALYDRWQSEANRVARLLSSGVIDSQTKDETLNQFKAAEAMRTEAIAKVVSSESAVVKAEADREKAVADITAVEAKRDVAKAEVRRVNALRGYLQIKSPFDGIITRRAVNVGDYVTADGKHGLFSVARIDPVRVVIQVPEADAELVAIGQNARITIQSIAGAAAAGKIVRTSWSLEPGSRTLRAEMDLANTDAKIRPGMYVYAKLTAQIPSAWSVPNAAVGKWNEEPIVYFVENGKAVRVNVQLVRADGQYSQISKFKRAGTTNWTDINGSESIASPAVAVTDGKSIP